MPDGVREGAGEPRTLILSMRRLAPLISRCLRYEFEDLVWSLGDAEIIAPDRDGRAAWRGWSRLDAAWPGASRLISRAGPPRGQKYDLLFVACQDLSDLRALAPLAPWRSAARFAVCHLEELYESRDLGRTGELALLRHFDVVCSGFHGSVGAFEKRLGRPCRYLPFSVDALNASPGPNPPPRTIDMYAMGRRAERTHEALLALAQQNPGWFYLYDTVRNAPVTCHTEHRRRLADLIKRTRYFLVNVGKANASDQTGGEAQIGMRYFEGAAGGAVLIGDIPRTEVFMHVFGWPDSVVALPYGSAEIAPIIRALDGDPARVERIRRGNVANSLRRHDHVYRWGEVLSVAGLKPTPPMERRVRLLEETARAVDAGAEASRVGGGAGSASSPIPA